MSHFIIARQPDGRWSVVCVDTKAALMRNLSREDALAWRDFYRANPEQAA